MKNKRFLIIFSALMLMLGLCACSLARPGAGGDAEGNAEGNADGNVQADRLIGYFITTEYIELFDMESYVNDHAQDIINGGGIKDGDEYQGKMYAGKTEDENGIAKYAFSELDGIEFFVVSIGEGTDGYTRVITGQAIINGNTKMTSTDDNGEKFELTAEVYVPVGERKTFYFNPVYQSSDGEVYLMSGDGILADMQSAGMLMKHSLSQELSAGGEGHGAYSCNVEVSIVATYIPEQVTIIEMAANGEVTKTQSFDASLFPDEYEAADGTEYIIMETCSTDEAGNAVFERGIIMPETEQSSISFFTPGEKGFICCKYCEVIW